jgi:hypothetical protein
MTFCVLDACFKCGSTDHKIRQCKEHLKDKQIRCEGSGKWAEDYITSICKCPNCNSELFKVEGNQPSLDLKCGNPLCESIFEVKSKCLSNKIIPDYIKIHGGNYHYFSENIKEKNLNLFVIIFKIDEFLNIKTVREILYYDNKTLQKAYSNGLNISNTVNFKGSEQLYDPSSNTFVNKFSIIKYENKSLIIIPNRLLYSALQFKLPQNQYMGSRIQHPSSPPQNQYMGSRIQHPSSPPQNQYMGSRIQHPSSPIDYQSHTQYMGNQYVSPYRKLNFM